MNFTFTPLSPVESDTVESTLSKLFFVTTLQIFLPSFETPTNFLEKIEVHFEPSPCEPIVVLSSLLLKLEPENNLVHAISGR